MEKGAQVVLVSNRGPVSFVESDGGFETTRGAGGMAGALDSVARRVGEDAVWIAATTSDTDRKAVRAGADQRLESELGYAVQLLDFESDLYSAYYDSVSNRMLWFTCHCLLDELGIENFDDDELRRWSEAYQPVNKRFSDAVSEVADPRSQVLFQDYHLTTAPGHLRRARSEQAILHFTHSSFCGPEGFARLPKRIFQEVIEGMLGADLIGFHVRAWVQGFLACCEALGFEVDRSNNTVRTDGRKSWVRSYPIPIDAADLRNRAGGDKAREWADRFAGDTEGPFIVRADRVEPSKNIIRGFEAFGRLLDRRNDLRGKACFVACLYPSRQSMPEYRRYTEQIKSTVERINEQHPHAIQLFMEDDFDRTIGALLIYDALLVNPIMDGMNLVSKEGPTVNEKDGALVLSSTAGSFDELGEDAVCIDDPLDVESTTDALEAALDMPAGERRERAARLHDKATGREPEQWIEAQLEDLAAIQEEGQPRPRP